jgi:glycosyltransferase involved in cell wall biosynthesis
MTPLITVGLPVLNGMPWLSECIESLRAQTFTGFRVLAIDDGSTDDSLAYLRSIRDSRFRVITQANRGLTATLNRMLEEVETPWLMRQDADDIALPQRLARVTDFADRFPDAGILYSDAAHYQNGHVLGRLRTTEGDPSSIRKLVGSGYLPAICHSAIVLNVARARDLGGYRFNLNVEEYDMYWRMALAHDVRYIPETLVGYRMRRGSVSDNHDRAREAAVLYIQYLLLSELRGRPPLPHEAVLPVLEALVDDKWLEYHALMREAMTSIGEQNYRGALRSLSEAFHASPRRFIQRVFYRLGQHQAVRLGQPPARFGALARHLWPQDVKDLVSVR